MEICYICSWNSCRLSRHWWMGSPSVSETRDLLETAWPEVVEVPRGEEGLPISSLFPGNFCWDHVGAVNLGIYWKIDGQDLILEGFGAQSSYRGWGLYGGQDLRWSHLSHLLVFIPLYVSSHQLWTKVKRWKHVIVTIINSENGKCITSLARPLAT